MEVLIIDFNPDRLQVNRNGKKNLDISLEISKVHLTLVFGIIHITNLQ